MATISTPGIGSGLDINSIVGAYIDAQRVPFEERVEEQEQKYVEQISAYGSMRNQIESLQNSLTSLAQEETFQSMKMSMSSSSYFTATIEDEADIGSFEVEVQQLATSQKLTSNAFDTENLGLTTSGRLDISLGADSFSISIDDTIDDDGETRDTTLEDIKDAINNADDNPGITASIVTDDAGSRLVFNSSKLGTENTISITAYDTSSGSDVEITDGSGLGKLQFDSTDAATIAASQMGQTTAAQDAIIIIDNSLTVTKSSNTFEDVIQGVTLELTEANETGETTSISISEDRSTIQNSVQGFVDAYNAYIELSQSVQYSNVEAEITGALNGDSTMRLMDRQLRSELTSAFGSGAFNVLSQFGITTTREGSLELDTSELASASQGDVEDLISFFVGTDEAPGFAVSMQNRIDIYSGSDGILSTRVDTLTGQVERLDKEKETFEERITRQEEMLYARFNAMDSQVALLNNTLDFVTSQLENLPGLVKKSD